MAYRTNVGMVQGVLGDDYGLKEDGSAPNLMPFIRAANLLVNRVATCAATKGMSLGNDELLEIETWLAAHAFKQSDRQIQSESTLGASATYTGQTGMGLEGTTYGQFALGLDISGCLRQLTSGNRASVMWLGKNPAEQVPYVPRSQP